MFKSAPSMAVKFLVFCVLCAGCEVPTEPEVVVGQPSFIAPTVMREVKPYSTSIMAPNETVRVVMSAANLTAEHNQDRPWVYIDFDPLLLSVERHGDMFDVTALKAGRAALFVCGETCGGDPLFSQPIVTVFDVR